jgi:hypothetical protein
MGQWVSGSASALTGTAPWQAAHCRQPRRCSRGHLHAPASRHLRSYALLVSTHTSGSPCRRLLLLSTLLGYSHTARLPACRLPATVPVMDAAPGQSQWTLHAGSRLADGTGHYCRRLCSASLAPPFPITSRGRDHTIRRPNAASPYSHPGCCDHRYRGPQAPGIAPYYHTRH